MSGTGGNGAIRALVVDDEPVARAYLRRLLEAQTGFTVMGEAGNGAEAGRIIESEQPDVVFLDIQMPGTDGFQMLADLEVELPAVVFVTAHSEYAVRAFDVHAVDYLLKPFDPGRFERTLAQVRQHLAGRRNAEVQQSLRALLAAMVEDRAPVYLERIAVRDRDETRFVRVEDIDWVQASSNYILVHAGGEEHLVRYALTALEKELDPRRFARIHRSTIVNVDRIASLSPLSHGDSRVHLKDGTELSLSRRYRDRLRGTVKELS